MGAILGCVARWTRSSDEEKLATLTGPELKAIRLKLGFTQSEIGELVFVEQSTWSDYERGKTRVPSSVVERLKRRVNEHNLRNGT